MMMNLMTVLVKKVFISSKPSIVCLLCPPPCGPFSIQESAVGGLSYKVKNRLLIAAKKPQQEGESFAVPLLFIYFSQSISYRVLRRLVQDPSAITGGPVAALPLRFGAPLGSHVPSASSRLLSASCRLYRAAFKSPLCKASPDVLSPSLHSLFQYPAAATSDRSFICLQ